MIEDMTVRNLSQSTQQCYIYAVAKFSRHFNRSPDQLGMEDVRTYQLHLVDQKYSWAHINQVACALRFFYGITLGHKEALERIVTGKEPEKLPPVPSTYEICPSSSNIQSRTNTRGRKRKRRKRLRPAMTRSRISRGVIPGVSHTMSKISFRRLAAQLRR
jgi:site-specific recombinase XerD